MAESDIALIVIATPMTAMHPGAGCVGSGQACGDDKPFTIDMKEARGLMRLAEHKGLLLSVFHNRRWDSDFLGVRFGVGKRRVGRRDAFRIAYRPLPAAGARPLAGAIGTGLRRLVRSLAAHDRPGAHAVRSAGFHRSQFRVRAARGEGGGLGACRAHLSHLRVVLHASIAGGGRQRKIPGLMAIRAAWSSRGIDQQEAQALNGMKPGAPGWGEDPDPLLIWDAQGNCREMPTPPGDQPALLCQHPRRPGRNSAQPGAGDSSPGGDGRVGKAGSKRQRPAKRIPVPLTAEETRCRSGKSRRIAASDHGIAGNTDWISTSRNVIAQIGLGIGFGIGFRMRGIGGRAGVGGCWTSTMLALRRSGSIINSAVKPPWSPS